MSVYVSILNQLIMDPIQNSIVAPIFIHSIQTLLLLPIILPIFNRFTAHPIKILLLLPIILPIFNHWIMDPLQNYVIVPILNQLTTVRIQILPIFDPLTAQPINKFLLLPLIAFIWKQINNDLFKFLYNHLLKCIFVPVKTHICYPFKCNSYVDKLKEKLKEKRDSLDQSVVEAAEALIQRKEEAKMKCFFGLCPNLKSHYQLSKEADKKASAIDKLLHQEGLHSILEPSVYSREALPSRMLLLNQVMAALKDPDLYKIGIYGLGGVGKTTLAKEVQRKAVEEKMFKPVVLVAVSQTPDLRRIQGEIADSIGLKFDAQEVPGRAIELKETLKKSKVLIILDDIWTEFKLNDVGIPLKDECKGSKLLFTSRSHDVLSREMGTKNEFSIEVLGEEETWNLFQKTLEDANNPELQAIAIQVSKKCSGLPLLVNIVAADLKNKELSAWRDALVKLSDLENEDIHGKVHKALKSSLENLPSNEAKSLFLLCSLFGQSNIPTNHLLTYAMGLGFFKKIVGVERARDRLCQTIEKLKTESLLLDGDMNDHVKMHDVVRDFARSIATKDHHAFFGITDNGLRQLWPADENCTRIVQHHCHISEFPKSLEYPNAELLSLHIEYLKLVIPNLFFTGIRKLKVLNLTGMHLMALPSSLKFLTNLHSLYMHQCRLKDVAIIGDLKQLEFLSFEESYIVELPRQLGELTQLKSLNLTKCSELNVIPPNVLRKLSRLEELYMDRSFDRWDENGNASLMELEELRQLTTIEVRAPDPQKLPNQLFSKRLERYRISIGNGSWRWRRKYGTAMTIEFGTSIHMEDWSLPNNLFLAEVKGMENGLYDLNEEGFPNLKHLYITGNKAIQYIIDSTMWVSCNAFPILETLSLYKLNSLEEICHGRLGMGSFRKLRKLHIIDCHKLINLFSFSTAKNLSQLQEMEVQDCDNLEALIVEGSKDGICNPRKVSLEIQTDMAIFPNLQTVEVSHLGNLKYIWHGEFTDDDSFCKLKSLKIEKCSNLKAVFATSKNVMRRFQILEDLEVCYCDKMEVIYQMEELGSIDAVAFELRNLKIYHMPSLKQIWSEDANGVFTFSNLKSVEVSNCDGLKCIFPESIASGLLQLEELKVEKCKMKYVVGNTKSGEPYDFKWPKLKHFQLIKNSQKANQLLSQLAKIAMTSLEELVIHFHDLNVSEDKYMDTNDFQTVSIFQNLKRLKVHKYSGLHTLMPYSVYFRNLTYLEVGKCNGIINLITVSTAKSLVLLKRMIIWQCKAMREIIRVESDGSEDVIGFNQLEYLELHDLPSLNSFCSDNYAFDFPILDDVTITKCPKMKTFSQQVLTPKLSKVKTFFYQDFDGYVFEDYMWEGSLNNTMQKLFMNRLDKKATDEEIETNPEETNDDDDDDDDDDETDPEETDDDDEAEDPEEADDDDNEADPEEKDDDDDDEADLEETDDDDDEADPED